MQTLRESVTNPAASVNVSSFSSRSSSEPRGATSRAPRICAPRIQRAERRVAWGRCSSVSGTFRNLRRQAHHARAVAHRGKFRGDSHESSSNVSFARTNVNGPSGNGESRISGAMGDQVSVARHVGWPWVLRARRRRRARRLLARSTRSANPPPPPESRPGVTIRLSHRCRSQQGHEGAGTRGLD